MRRWASWSLLAMAACGPVTGEQGGGESGSSSTTSGAVPLETTESPTSSSASFDSTAGSSPATSDADSSGTSGQPECESRWPNVTMIACDDLPGPRRGFTLDVNAVFYAAGGKIFTVDAIDPEDPTLVVDDAGDVGTMVTHGPWLYWAALADGEIGRVDPSSGVTERIDGWSKPNSLAVDDAHVYLSEYTDAGAVFQLDWTSGAFGPLYADLDHPGLLILDGDSIYLADSTNSGDVPTPILRGTTTGDPLESLHSDGGIIAAMILEAGWMYVARYHANGSTIERTRVEPVGSTEVLATSAQPLSMTLTRDRVYWLEGFADEFSNYANVRSVAKAGGEPIEHVAHDDVLIGIATTADDVVVFTTSNGVARLDE